MKALNKSFEVRLAQVDEVVSILREPRLLAAVGLASEDEIPDYFAERKCKFHIAKYQEYSILFAFNEVCLGVYEFHIACPEASKQSCRLLTYVALKWVYLAEGNYVKYFYTSCPEGSIANFIRKFGAKEVKRVGNLIHFMATPKDFQFV